MAERLPIVVPHPQESERALRQIGSILTGLGFYETVTFSFISPRNAEAFLRPGLETVAVDDDRRKAEPTLRPSVLPSLLSCRKSNQDARNEAPGGVRLFELAPAYAQSKGQSVESRKLAMIIDVPGVSPGKQPKHDQLQAAVRIARGAVESVVRAIAGPHIQVALEPAKPQAACYRPEGFASVTIGAHPVGELGVISDQTLRAYDIDIPVVACEIELDALTSLTASRARVTPLPAFPPIDRDLSIVIAEDVTWASVKQVIAKAAPERLTGAEFVGTYRGKPVPQGAKSLTLRLSFRDPTRTLVREEVDPEVETVVKALQNSVGATLRT
jgi:phenylalanyl-tRNA synthetase beta chain